MEQGDSNLALLFNSQVFSLETTWMEGYAYGEQGTSNQFNPFKFDQQGHAYWSEGWEAGFYGEAPLFPEHVVEIDPMVNLVAKDRGQEPKFNVFEKWLYGVGATVGVVAIAASMLIDVAA